MSATYIRFRPNFRISINEGGRWFVFFYDTILGLTFGLPHLIYFNTGVFARHNGCRLEVSSKLREESKP